MRHIEGDRHRFGWDYSVLACAGDWLATIADESGERPAPLSFAIGDGCGFDSICRRDDLL